MPPENEATTVREAVGVFATPETLQEAIDELMSSGFDRADLSLLASEDAVEAKLGHMYRKAANWRTMRAFPGRPTSQRNRLVMRRVPSLGGWRTSLQAF
jgi:hypothetical protein